MALYPKYQQHAVQCGLNMSHAMAIPILGTVQISGGRLIVNSMAINSILAHDVIDPEGQEPLVHAGTKMTPAMLRWLADNFGLDYITVVWGLAGAYRE